MLLSKNTYLSILLVRACVLVPHFYQLRPKFFWGYDTLFTTPHILQQITKGVYTDATRAQGVITINIPVFYELIAYYARSQEWYIAQALN
jgi:hypothetical protein